MNVKLNQQVETYLASDNPNPLEMIESLYPSSLKQLNANTKFRQIYQEPKFNKKYFPNGVFYNICELDFIAFSYSILKKEAKDPRIISFIEVLDKFDQNDLKVKKLRIALFLSLSYIYSGLCDFDLSARVLNIMYTSIEKAKQIVEQNNIPLIASVFDSVSFSASKEEGQKICDQINAVLDAKLRLKFYPRVVKYINISHYHMEDGTVLVKLLTKTPEPYEKVKQKVIDAVEKGDITSAYNVVENCDLADGVKRGYVTALNEIKERGGLNE